MSRQIFIEDDTIIDPTDYKSKYEQVIEILNAELFNGLTEENTKEVNIITGTSKKIKASKNDVLPVLSPLHVSTRLNECLRVYRPLTLTEAKLLTQQDLLNALKYFMKLNSEINKFIAFIPDKPLFSIFCGFTTQVYNELMQDSVLSDILISADEYIISLNTTASQANLVDAKTTAFKLQANSIGHGVTRQVEQLTVVQNNYLDKKAVTEKLSRFQAMIGASKK